MDRSRLGRCYELAGNKITEEGILGQTKDATDWRLVHGTIGPNKNPHAWVRFVQRLYWPDGREERLEMVWEPVSESVLPVEAFDNLFHANAHVMYDAKEAMTHMVKHETYGPWYFVAEVD